MRGHPGRRVTLLSIQVVVSPLPSPEFSNFKLVLSSVPGFVSSVVIAPNQIDHRDPLTITNLHHVIPVMDLIRRRCHRHANCLPVVYKAKAHVVVYPMQ